MSTNEIANRLVELCRTGQYEHAQIELYAADAESIEPAYAPVPYLKGLDAIRQKGQGFRQMIREVHGGHVSDPIGIGNHFSVTMSMDITYQDGNRRLLEEVCVYEVKDGKIVKEQFFF